MRKGGGKSKGGKFELAIISKLTKAFKPLGIQEDDCFRTKNSGATKSQPGDIQFSPRFAKLFPVLIECKHYRSVSYLLGKKLDKQQKSNFLTAWWKQVVREQAQRKDKVGILVFRQNRCPDVVAMKVSQFNELMGYLPQWHAWSWSMFTTWKKETVMFVLFDEWLKFVIVKKQANREKKAKRIANADRH